jgi:myo-inositol-1(or 4)-monophosphatase
MDHEAALKTLKSLIVPLGEKLVAEWGKATIAATKDKESLDIATTLDQEIEHELTQKLKEQFPDTGFLVEEDESQNSQAEFRWAIDPIDGTKYYASRIPLFTISVGLLHNDEPVLGVIYNPVSRQLYEGSTAIPATLNQLPIHIRPEDTLARSVVSVDILSDPENLEYSAWERAALHDLHTSAYRIRIVGSGSLSLAWISSGSVINAYLAAIPPTKLVDVAAGLAICQAAGAHIETIQHPANPDQRLAIVGTKAVVKQIAAIVG